jgi:hypothetical protein
MTASGILDERSLALDAPETTALHTEANRKIFYPFHMLAVFGLSTSTLGT